MSAASRAYPVLIMGLALICFALALFVPAVLNDGDTFMHIAAGAWMLDHHQVATIDPFSLTFRDHPWVSHEWLSEVAMALAYRIGHWPGFLLLFASAAAASVFLLGRAARRWLDPLPAALLVLGAMFTLFRTFLARPHLLVLPIMVLWATIILTARSQGRAPPLVAALLMIPWVNLHGSFLVGPAFAAAAALEAWTQSPGRRAQVARAWGIFLLATLAATCATPHGIAGLLLPFHLLAVPALQNISEWAPVNFAHQPPIMPLMLGLLYMGLVYSPRLPRLRVALVVILLFQALLHARNQLLFGVFGLLVLAEPLGRYFRGAAAQPPPPARLPAIAWAAWLALAAAVLVVRVEMPIHIGDAATRPVTALAHLPPGLAAQPVLNSYNFGSYLIFRGIRPYIDGRVELYGNAYVQHYLDMVHPSHALLAATLAQDHITWTLFSAGSAVADMMDLMPGWKRIYADKYAVVLARTDALGAPTQPLIPAKAGTQIKGR